jgi:hypothetical protein
MTGKDLFRLAKDNKLHSHKEYTWSPRRSCDLAASMLAPGEVVMLSACCVLNHKRNQYLNACVVCTPRRLLVVKKGFWRSWIFEFPWHMIQDIHVKQGYVINSIYVKTVTGTLELGGVYGFGGRLYNAMLPVMARTMQGVGEVKREDIYWPED